MSIASLIASGSKVWLDGIGADQIAENRARGITGATSNPVIVSNIVKGGQLDDRLDRLVARGSSDEEVAWQLTDELVTSAQEAFLPVWEETRGNDGYVSFELDPLLEDDAAGLDHAARVERYVELGQAWSSGHRNRMIKVPATRAGLDSLEELAALGVTLNVTLMFTERQYRIARDAIWRGAQRRANGLRDFKSVYSVFVSRVDAYTATHVPELSSAAQGMVGIVNAKRIWQENRDFWADKGLPLQQEIVFASTGVKTAGDPPDKYVEALAGDGILTNPPETNDAVEASGKPYSRQVDRMPAAEVAGEIAEAVDMATLERVLMEEGVRKFIDPQKALIAVIEEKRAASKKDRG